MPREEKKFYKAVPHKVHLAKNPYAEGDSYSPRKHKKGIHCTGEHFHYVVPWEVKRKPNRDSVPEES